MSAVSAERIATLLGDHWYAGGWKGHIWIGSVQEYRPGQWSCGCGTKGTPHADRSLISHRRAHVASEIARLIGVAA